MKKFVLILLAFFVLASAAFASPTPSCLPGTLDTYLVASFTCMINQVTFDTWSYSASAGGLGSPVAASAIRVTPVLTPGNEGFEFNSGWGVNSVDANHPNNPPVPSFEDSLIKFSARSAGILDLELFFNGASTGTGFAQVTEQYCLGASPVSNCSGGTLGQIMVTNPPPGFSDHVFFAPQTVVSVSKDIMVNTGNGVGTATISHVVNNFSSPEPLSFVLLGSGLLGLGLLRKRIKP